MLIILIKKCKLKKNETVKFTEIFYASEASEI